MTLRHLNIFLSVCMEKNMTKAAKKLYMTQPSVTQAIKELEEYYHVLLFERIGKKIKISNEGYRLLPLAENIIKTFEESKTIMKGEFVHEIAIGASATIGTYLLNDFIKKTKELKNTEISYFVDNTLNIEEMVLNGKIDIGIVEGKTHSTHIRWLPFAEDELILVCASSNIKFKNDNIGIEELNGIDFISREDGSGTREFIDAIFLQNNIQVKNIATVNNIEAIKNMVIGDAGFSIVPEISVEKEIKSGLIKHIKIENLRINREFKIIYHKNKVLNSHLKLVLELLTKDMKN